MLTSLSFVFLLGLAMAALCQKFKIPRIIGMLVTGILLGPCVLNWLSESILGISSELRQMALIIILLKAGLSLNLADLKKVGRPALMMSCVPASFEILAFVIFAPAILHISRVEAAVMGAVLGYFCDRPVFHIHQYGSGRQCTCCRFYQYSGIHSFRHSTGSSGRIRAQLVL